MNDGVEPDKNFCGRPVHEPNQLEGQYIPNIGVASNGRVDVAWWDTRDDPGTRSNDVYYTFSEDNGKTWSKNLRITDQSINRTYGVWGVNYDMSFPPGIASTSRFAIFGSDDTRFTDTRNPHSTAPRGGTSDMFGATVQFAAVGGGTSNVVKIALAGVASLLVVGLVLLGVAVASRSAESTPTSRRAGAKTPAGVGSSRESAVRKRPVGHVGHNQPRSSSS